MYLLDPKGNVYGPGSNTTAILTGVSDFEITVDGKIYAISNGTTTSNKAFLDGVWDKFLDKQEYKMYSSATYNKVTLYNQKPIFTDAKKKLVGYGFHCVNDISSGVDGSFWALDCDADKDGNFGIIKYDPFRGQVYKVGGKRGIRIGAFNEVSAAVLNKQGQIFISSDTGSQENINWVPLVEDLRTYLPDSQLVTKEDDRKFIRSLFIKDYSVADLVYRASRDGASAAAFHKFSDNRGPVLIIIRATNGRVFGGFTKRGFRATTDGNRYETDPAAYLFSLEKRSKHSVKGDGGWAIYDDKGYGPTFGDNHDIYIDGDFSMNTKNWAGIGKSYELPAGISWNTDEQRTYLAGTEKFQVLDIETYALSN